MHWRIWTFLVVYLCATFQSYSASGVSIALVSNSNPNETEKAFSALVVEEIGELLEEEFEVSVREFPISDALSPSEGIFSLLDRIYADESVDIVVVTDEVSHILAGRKSEFLKPTFLPLVFNARVLGYPWLDGVSGVENLNYLTSDFVFDKELRALRRVYPFNNAVFLSDAGVLESIGAEALETAQVQAGEAGVNLSILPYQSDHNQLMDSFDDGVEAVIFGALPNASYIEKTQLVNSLIARGLPSFSVVDETLVQSGALATNSPDTDWSRIARRTALNIQAVLLGTQAAEIPVVFRAESKLTINAATARALSISPSFDVLAESVVINRERIPQGRIYTLAQVAQKSLQENLSIAVQRLRTEQVLKDMEIARGGLLPTVSASLSYDRRDESASTLAGTFAKSSTDASLNFSMPLFDEGLWANYAVQKYAHLSEQQVLRETELDIIESAILTYLNVLVSKTSLQQEENNLSITADNLRLAENRVSAGTANASDLFRWQSEIAIAKQGVLFARSDYEQQKQALNSILNRPINELFETSEETLNNPSLMISDQRILDQINNPRSLLNLTNFLVEKGVDRSPELKQIEYSISINERLKKSSLRDFWIPDVSLYASLSSNLDEDREGGLPREKSDWQVGIEASIPIFEGGTRVSEYRQSVLALREVETQYSDTRNTIEENIRNLAESAHASYLSIQLAKDAEVAIQKNYDLTSDAYAQGTASILDLLDSQEALFEARESALNAVYSFLIELMQMQRATGEFDFFLSPQERLEMSNSILSVVR